MSEHQLKKRSVRVAAVLVAVFALGGCSGADSTGGPSEDVVAEITDAPSTGPAISGTGYSFAAPKGWSVPPDVSLPGMDTVVANMADADGFADNVNVVLSPGGLLTPDDVESAGVDELEAGGALNVQVQDRVMVAGSESAHLSADFGTSYRVEQFYVSDAEQTYVVTFSFSQTVPETNRNGLAHAVLASWAWL